MARPDYTKRRELFMEFLYYLFDSFVMPLVRSNFHVTESNAHKNRLFYFRHDVWRMLAEPTLTSFKLSTYEELSVERARRILGGRLLGFSQIRLLPKKVGARAIINLRRRPAVNFGGRVVLGRSINSILMPVFDVLKYEKVNDVPEGTVSEMRLTNTTPVPAAGAHGLVALLH